MATVRDERSESKTYPPRSIEIAMQRFRKSRSEALTFSLIVYSINSNKPTGEATGEDIERDRYWVHTTVKEL